MSHNRNHIIITALVASGQFTAQENAKLEAIGEKETPCSKEDADHVARIVKKKLREPVTA